MCSYSAASRPPLEVREARELDIDQLVDVLLADETGPPVRMVLDGPDNGRELFGFCVELLACCVLRMFSSSFGITTLERLSRDDVARVGRVLARAGIAVRFQPVNPGDPGDQGSVDVVDATDDTPMERIRLTLPVHGGVSVGFAWRSF